LVSLKKLKDFIKINYEDYLVLVSRVRTRSGILPLEVNTLGPEKLEVIVRLGLFRTG